MADDEKNIFADVDPAKMKELQAVTRSNAKRMEKLSNYVDMSIFPAKLQHMLIEMVNVGVLTPEQLIDMELSWERDLHRQLVEAEGSVKEAIAQARAQEAEAVSKIIKPNGSGKLIVPGA